MAAGDPSSQKQGLASPADQKTCSIRRLAGTEVELINGHVFVDAANIYAGNLSTYYAEICKVLIPNRSAAFADLYRLSKYC
jgi:hypothetical protein